MTDYHHNRSSIARAGQDRLHPPERVNVSSVSPGCKKACLPIDTKKMCGLGRCATQPLHVSSQYHCQYISQTSISIRFSSMVLCCYNPFLSVSPYVARIGLSMLLGCCFPGSNDLGKSLWPRKSRGGCPGLAARRRSRTVEVEWPSPSWYPNHDPRKLIDLSIYHTS